MEVFIKFISKSSCVKIVLSVKKSATGETSTQTKLLSIKLLIQPSDPDELKVTSKHPSDENTFVTFEIPVSIVPSPIVQIQFIEFGVVLVKLTVKGAQPYIISAENVGVTGWFTVTVCVTGKAHCPADGENV